MKMRDLTENELTEYNESLKSLCKPTAMNLFELQELRKEINLSPNPFASDTSKNWYIDKVQTGILNNIIDELISVKQQSDQVKEE